MLLRAWPVLFCFSFFYGIPGGGLSGVLGVTSVDPASFTLLDGVDPSPVVPCSGVWCLLWRVLCSPDRPAVCRARVPRSADVGRGFTPVILHFEQK